MRALSTATVSFGLVSIPVKLYASGESGATIRFNQMHAKDGARLRQQLICSKEGTPVSRDEIVKGYEFAKGQYVLFTPQELKALEAESSHAIDITEFIKAEQVDRIYVEKTYYLGPDKGAARAYRLLNKALWETGRAAIAKYSARGKEYLVLVRPMEDGLAMEQLRYAGEMRAFDDVPIDDADVKPEELQLAIQLIDQAASDQFKPEKYTDGVRERVLAMIQRKIDGEDITVAPTEQPEHKIIDIMEALKASLAGDDGSDPGRKPAKRAAGKKKTAAKKKTTSRKKAARG